MVNQHGDDVRGQASAHGGTATAAGGVPLYFLMFNVDAPDGVSRAVLTLANHLSLTHRVEVISLYCRHRGPAYAISPRVQVTYLSDHPPVRRGADDDDQTRADRPAPAWWPPSRDVVRRLLGRRASRLSQGRGFPNLSLLTDLQLRRKVRSIRTGMLISTRPALHVAAARLARRGVVTIGQDHLNFESRSSEPGSISFIDEAARRGLDALVTLTATDATDYERLLATSGTRVTTIPNAMPWPLSQPREHDSRVVVAAGRLVPRKGMDRLIRAFAPVAERHPGWELRIYGVGKLEEWLRSLIDELGVTTQVRLMGHTDDLPAAFDDAAFFASASRAEGFPMVMLEAMSKGLPLVSFDCPRGPRDIIRHGHNGLLVPDNDIAGLTVALETMVTDDDQRRSMGAQALADAEQFVVARIAESWESLFEDLCRHRLGTRPGGGLTGRMRRT